MKRLRILIIAVAVMFASVAHANIYECVIQKVVDGDTVDTMCDLGFGVLYESRMRLLGIDAPETRTKNKDEKKAGLITKEFVTIALLDKVVFIEVKDVGKFGRPLAIITYTNHSGESVNLNKELISKGLAIEYWGGKKPEFKVEN